MGARDGPLRARIGWAGRRAMRARAGSPALREVARIVADEPAAIFVVGCGLPDIEWSFNSHLQGAQGDRRSAQT